MLLMTHRRLLLLAGVLLVDSAFAQEVPAPGPSGRVTDLDGRPEEGALVELVRLPLGWQPSPWPDVTAREEELLAAVLTDEAGGFEFSSIGLDGAPTLMLRASAAGRETLAMDRDLLVPGLAWPSELDLRLGEGLTLRGRVVNADGRPVSGVTVGATGRSPMGLFEGLATSAADGTFELRGLPALARLRLAALMGDGRSAISLLWTDGTSPLDAVLVLKEPRRLVGRLVDAATGKAMARVPLALSLADQPPGFGRNAWSSSDPDPLVRRTLSARGESDEQGRFDLQQPAAGEWRLLSPGHASVVLRSGDNKVSASRPLQGRVVGARSEGGGAGLVRGVRTGLEVAVDRSGRFIIPAKKASPLQLWLQGQAAPLAFVAGRREARLQAGRSVEGRVRFGRVETGEDGAQVVVAGEPAAGARVVLALEGAQRLVTGTDAGGRYRFDGVPPGRVRIFAGLGGTEFTEPVSGHGREPSELLLLTRDPVSLRVSAVGGRRPMGSRVFLLSHEGAPPVVVSVGKSGETSASLPTGAWTAWAWAPGRPGTADSVSVVSWRRAREVEPEALELELPPAARLRVDCRGGEDRPVRDALLKRKGAPPCKRVFRSDSSFARSCHSDGRLADWSDAQGRASWSGVAPESKHRVSGSHPLHAPSVVSDVLPEVVGQLDFERRSLVEGHVLDAEGRTVAGAIVRPERKAGLEPDQPLPNWYQLRAGSPATLTDETGAFHLAWLPPGEYELRAGASGHQRSEASSLRLEAGSRHDLEFILAPAVEARGTVVDPTGQPVSGAEVSVVARGEERSAYSPPGLPEAVSRDDGGFVLEGLPVDREVFLKAERRGEESAPVLFVAGAEDLVLALVARGSIDGLVSRNGEPSPGGSAWCVPEVEAKGKSWRRRGHQADIDAEGRFLFEGLAPGPHVCEAEVGDEAMGRAEDIEVPERGAVTVRIPLEEKPTLVVRVRDAADGSFLAGARVSGVNGDGRGLTDASGRAEVALNPLNEESELSIGLEGYGWQTERITRPLPAGLEVRLSRLARVSGRLVDAVGSPVAGVTISASDAGSALSEADGSFEFSSRRSGSVRLEVFPKEGARWSGTKEIQVPPDGLSGVVFEIKRQETAGFAVTVLSSGAPVAGADVRLDRVGGQNYEAMGKTDSAGRWQSSDVPAGEHHVRLRRSGEPVYRRAATIMLGADERRELSLELPAGVTLEGVVTRSGEPLAAAEVTVTGLPGDGMRQSGNDLVFFGVGAASIATDSAGRFQAGPFSAVEGSVTVKVVVPVPRQPGDRDIVEAVALEGRADGSIVTVSFDVAGASIAGHVTSSGAALEGAVVTARPAVTESSMVTLSVMSTSLQSLTDAQGRYEVAGLEPGARYEVTASRDGYATQGVQVLAPTAAADLDLRIGGRPGRVLTAAGVQVDSLSLTLFDEAGNLIPVGSVALDEAGAFTVPAPLHERYRYAAAGWAHATSIGVVESGDDLLVSLGPGGFLEPRVVDSAGRPVEGVGLILVAVGGRAHDLRLFDPYRANFALNGRWGRVESDADGRLRSAAVAPGQYTLRGEHQGTTGELILVVREGEVARGDLMLIP